MARYNPFGFPCVLVSLNRSDKFVFQSEVLCNAQRLGLGMVPCEEQGWRRQHGGMEAPPVVPKSHQTLWRHWTGDYVEFP